MFTGLVSIITPTFNSRSSIEATYLSIKNQTYDNWEWVVTDDCSMDSTLDYLLELQKIDTRVKVFSNNENSGAAVTRNNSISKSKGEYLAFLDSDDLWEPRKIEKQLAFMGGNIDFSFTAYQLIDDDGHNLGQTVDSTQIGCFSYEDMLRKKATLGCSTVMLRKSGFDKIEMPLLRTGQDYALWLSLLREGAQACILSEVLTKYRISPKSISRNKIKKAKRQWQIYRELEDLSILKSSLCFCFYAIRAIFRQK